MKDKDEFSKQMENLKVPDAKPGRHQEIIKMTVLNANRSAVMGIWLIVIPSYFLFCVVMEYYFHKNQALVDSMHQLMTGLSNKIYLRSIWAIVLIGMPVLSVILNMLAILHVQHNKMNNELIVTIKIKTLNLLLVFLSLAIITIFMTYAISIATH
ncbi:MAG: hypothetical protein JWR12_1896 [Mucilaginibacter sp.]|nr:hypothetical protein [Mucilaginibacter sp.]